MAGFPLDWMKFYPRDTLADGRFQGWTMDERGAWFSLVLQCWTDGSIPAGVTAIGRLLHLSAPDASRIWSAIGDRFSPHPSEPGRLVSPRLEEEREKALAVASQRSDAGTKGAITRWNKPKRSHGKRMRPPSQPDGEADPVATANDAAVGRGEGSTTTTPAEPVPARPPDPAETRWPNIAAALVALWDRGRDARWPSGEKAEETSDRLERLIAAATLPVAVDLLDASLQADPGHPWLGWHTEALAPKKAPRKRPTSDRWQDRLTRDEFHQAHAELRALHPDLEAAPLGCTGDPAIHPVQEIAALNEKWRSVAEGRV